VTRLQTVARSVSCRKEWSGTRRHRLLDLAGKDSLGLWPEILEANEIAASTDPS